VIRVKLERDRALVESPCLRIRTGRYDRFLWWHRRPRYFRYDRKADG
jgi:hypothetical protein